MNPTGRLLWIAGALALVAACEPGDPTPAGPQVLNCDPIEPGDAPIRRMTRAEYNNTVRDLLGDTSQPASSFVPEEEALGFNNQATSLGVTQLLAEQMMNAAEAVAQKATSDLASLMPYCSVAAVGEDACAKLFIERFGRRAYRRPITPAEASRFFDLFAWGRDTYDFASGLGLVIQGMLQSPHFLYRVELGMPDPVEGDVVPLTSYEMASRLSYLLWNSMPDDELFDAADAGKLATKEQIAAQVRRMLEHPRARQAVANFHSQWLKLTHIENVAKDSAVYPLYHDGLRSLWKKETEAFLEHVVFDGEGDVATLLAAPYSMMNAELATFYGIADPPSGEAFERVDLDPARRAGLLTHASLLAVNAKPNQSSPIHRGKFVREMLLCQTLPPPPNNIEIKPPEVKPGVTTRERFKEHANNPACSACHALMDPIGFGFENYDGIGLWRDKDQGLPVDASGNLYATKDIDGPFSGAVELANELAASAEVRQCVATQWFRFGYGRAEGKADACAMHEIQEAFAASGNNIKELLVALTQTEAFLYRHRHDPTK
ncbi:MAG: DUF1592 domain-containing protein [Polyangiaceae bacterium]|nr:DUF1592 domain-containing protein [Polyangiaceae bacterium]